MFTKYLKGKVHEDTTQFCIKKPTLRAYHNFPKLDVVTAKNDWQ